jgi:hypothetical protein
MIQDGLLTFSRRCKRDTDLLVRKVDYPENQDNPLYPLMFPVSEKESEQREEEIRWMVEGLLKTLSGQRENIRMACRVDGTPVGLVGWIIVGQATGRHTINGGHSDARKTDKVKLPNYKRSGIGNNWCPSTMDVASWHCVSEKLRTERERVLQNYDGDVCRKSRYYLIILYVIRLTSHYRYHYHVSGSRSSAARGWLYANAVGL